MSHKSAGSVRDTFLKSDKAAVIRRELERMIDNPLYNTIITNIVSIAPSYFVEKHMQYMSGHPGLDHSSYMRNLKIRTRRSK